MCSLYNYALLLLGTVIDSAWLIHMVTKGQILIVKAGETVQLECEYFSESFSLFENPIVWRKAQRTEESQINMMGNLMEPFASAKRFRATFQSDPPKYMFGLTIAEVSLEDNGNYTCHVTGPHNTVLSSVTHYIFVTAPVDRVLIADQNSTHLPTGASDPAPQSLIFTEEVPGTLRCVAFGGSPPPEILVQFGAEDVTDQFALVRTSSLSRRRGLRFIHYTTERTTQQFKVRAADDGKVVKCVVTVPGSPGSNYSFARITVHYAALIRCDETEASVGDRNVFLRCEIESKPRPHAIFWIINSNGTALSEGDVVDGFWTLIMDRTDDALVTQLFIKTTTLSTFRRYILVVENAVTVRTTEVELRQKFHTTSKTDFAKQRGGSFQKNSDLVPRGLVSSKRNCSPPNHPKVHRHLDHIFTVTVFLELLVLR